MKEDIPKKKKLQRSLCGGTMVLVIISVILFGTLSFTFWFTDLFNTELLKILVIANGSYLYESWANPPVSPLVCVYSFNYTNTDPFLKGYTDKLQIQEVGPYCYIETTKKVLIKFHDNGTVSYKENKTFTFMPAASHGRRDDTLVIPNVPFLSALAIGRNMNIIPRMGFYTLLRSSEPFSTVKAHDSLFGYDNTLVTIRNTVSRFTNNPVQFTKFGMLAKRVGLSKDTLTVFTGKDDPEQVGQVESVNGITNLNVWNTAACNAVSGSDGSRFPQTKVLNKKSVAIFSRDSCRTLPLVFHSEQVFQNEIPTFRYTIDPNYFKSSSNKANNSCYCTANTECAYDGVFDISPCAEEAPILISQPHFLNGDPEIGQYLEGLNPDPKKHDFFLDIHPKYGMTLGTLSRIQINVEVKKPQEVIFMRVLPNQMILPLLWMEISSNNMPENMFNMVYHATFTVHYLEVFLKWSSLTFFVIASVCLVRRTTDYLKQHW